LRTSEKIFTFSPGFGKAIWQKPLVFCSGNRRGPL
jgi:hypothetical protein